MSVATVWSLTARTRSTRWTSSPRRRSPKPPTSRQRLARTPRLAPWTCSWPSTSRWRACHATSVSGRSTPTGSAVPTTRSRPWSAQRTCRTSHRGGTTVSASVQASQVVASCGPPSTSRPRATAASRAGPPRRRRASSSRPRPPPRPLPSRRCTRRGRPRRRRRTSGQASSRTLTATDTAARQEGSSASSSRAGIVTTTLRRAAAGVDERPSSAALPHGRRRPVAPDHDLEVVVGVDRASVQAELRRGLLVDEVAVERDARSWGAASGRAGARPRVRGRPRSVAGWRRARAGVRK